MGAESSKYQREQQENWRNVCTKKIPPFEQAAAMGKSLPHFRDIHLSGYGANGVTVTADIAWPDRLQVRIAAPDLHDLLSRCTVDRIRCNGCGALALNQVFHVLSQSPHVQLKELYFVRCETDKIDGRVFGDMLRSQSGQSHIQIINDSEGALRMSHSRNLGHDAKTHCLYFMLDELVHEEWVMSDARMEGPVEFDYLPMQARSGTHLVHGEKKNWSNLKKGDQPPFRLYYPDLRIEVVGRKVKITPDTRWNSWLTTWPSRVGNYMQYVDAEAVTIECKKHTLGTSTTLKDLINNLAVSQALAKSRRITFTGGDYSLITSVQFADFLEVRKHDLEWIGFDTGCVNVQPMRDALNQVYQEAKTRPDREELVLA